MAQVKLGRHEVERNELPQVCMVCGEPATAEKSKKFAWYPNWVWVLIPAGLVVFAVVAAVLTKRMRMMMPFCSEHKNHYLWRNLSIAGAVLPVVMLGIAAIILVSQDQHRRADEVNFGGILCIATIALGLAWLVFAVVLQTSAIRPVEITDRSITLTKVNDRFIEALEEERDRLDQEYEQRPRRRRPADEDDLDYDPSPRPRRPLPPDAFREER